MDMDELVNGQGEQPEPKDVAAVQSQQAEEPVVEQPAGEGAPSAPAGDSHVPLAALEAERKQRKDHKERADRAEERLRVYEEQMRSQPQGQPQQRDPVADAENRMQAMVLNTSERFARKQYGDETVDAAFERFKAEVSKNPALHTQAMAHADPWDFVVTYGQRLSALDEIGNDPKAYRAKVEAEIRASLEDPTPAPLKVPQSLNGVRSSAPRSAPGFTGPTPLEAIVNTR